MRHLETHIEKAHWTFGGGTVLMLRLGHRQSKDIDLFVPDPQYLGYVNPRLSDVAESITTDYDENADFIKLYLKEGEVDVVVGESLTEQPFDLIEFAGQIVRVETCAEIIAKKIWHRGDRAKGRDLYDLCAVADCEPGAIDIAKPFMRRHGRAFLDGLRDRASVIEREFEAIDAIGFTRPAQECMDQARDIIEPFLVDIETVAQLGVERTRYRLS